MLQLVPFYFISQVVFGFTLLTILKVFDPQFTDVCLASVHWSSISFTLATIPVTTMTNNNLKTISLNPSFITGFADGESSFIIGVSKDSKNTIGFRVKAIFQIHLHSRDAALLEEIQSHLGGIGYVYYYSKQERDVVIFSVTSIIDLEGIIAHFDRYPLITQKWSDFQLFKQALELIKRKEHLTIEGLNKIVGIKAMMNGNGLSDKLKATFPDAPLVARCKPINQEINPDWLAGFVTAEGCFSVYLKKSPKSKLGYSVTLRFSISQHSRDSVLMQSIVEYLGCGQYRGVANKSIGEFTIESIKDIDEKLIPFFKKYPLRGVKVNDYKSFLKAVEIVRSKAHLTESGLAEIRDIISVINSSRS